ncbi:uncharacterized protein EDB91DRAFT_297782 [Suillus paluster]|uniref:uncharacterized protein n=1 Tax=Suillus paluster TaxID=48578 RepID=UPI001B876E5C|nr:uncharacterized protein EDB91DRAFT_297782 [Suillus paluster]KAG1742778.1 hypothetical protein EDB91DRAFT_297782 [Suillus paluster]
MSSGIIVLFVIAFAVYFYSCRRSRLPLPPGPRPKFFTGNAHQLPKQESWRMYATWAEIYGPIFSFRVPGQQFIVLSSIKTAY